MGDEIVRQERDFNRRAGFTAKPTTVRRRSWSRRRCAPSGNRYDVPEADLDSMFAS